MSEEPRLPIERGRIHGIPNMELTPEMAAQVGAVFGTVLGSGAIVVTARDYYPPSRMFKRAFSSGLMSTGVTVIDFHAATTPELTFAIKRFGAKAGVQFTVSPYKENAVTLKLLNSLGAEISQERLNEIRRMYETRHVVRTLPSRIGWVSYAEYIHEIYVSSVVGFVDADSIIARSLSATIDYNFGPADNVIPDLLSELSVDTVTLNARRPPVTQAVRHLPRFSSLRVLSRVTKASGADLGVAFCTDANRATFIDDRGNLLGPDVVAALFISMLPERSTVVTLNYASSLVDRVSAGRKVRVVRVRGSTGDVVRQVRRHRAAFGFTSRGEFIFPAFSPSPDGILALCKLLELLSHRERNLSTLVSALPQVSYYHKAVSVNPEHIERVMHEIYIKYTNSVHEVVSVKVAVDNRVCVIEPDPEGGRIVVKTEDSSQAGRDAVNKLVEDIELLASSF